MTQVQRLTASLMIGFFIFSFHIAPLLAEDKDPPPQNSDQEDRKSFFDAAALAQNTGLAAVPTAHDSRISLELQEMPQRNRALSIL